MLLRIYQQLFKSISIKRSKSTTPDLTSALAAEKEYDYCSAQSKLEHLIASHPDNRASYVALGRVLAKSGQMEKSISVLSHAASLWPTDSTLQLSLGNSLLLHGNANEAIPCFYTALSTNPFHVPTLVGLGNALREIGQFETAHYYLSRAIEIAPQIPEAYDNLGQLLQDMGRLTESIVNFELALRINPSLSYAQLHLGISRLLDGNYVQGWAGYEARFTATETPIALGNYTIWNNQNLDEGTLRILSEQGLGDEIMFASCIPDVLPKVKKIIVECSPKLVNLFQRSFPSVSVVKKHDINLSNQKNLNNEYVIPIGSLGSIFRKTIFDFPDHKGYLISDLNRRLRWRENLRALGKGLKVGIAWSGGTRSTRKALRSIPLAQWDVLLKTQGVHFISLQHTDSQEEITAIVSRTGIQITHWQEAIDDYDDTAALVSELDLIISVQTAIVHLAGALGKVVWVLVPECPEWRYLRKGTTLPWYPSARLFRQQRRFEWLDVITDVHQELMKQVDSTTENDHCTVCPNSSFVESIDLYKNAMSLIKIGDHKNALSFLKRCLETNPDDRKASLAIANVMHLSGEYTDAISYYRQIIKNSPDNYLAYCNLGNTLRELARYDEAIVFLNKALDLAPNCSEAAHNLGLCYLALGNSTIAIDNFNRALTTNPNNTSPLRALFELYRESGDIFTLIQLLREHISRHGEITEAIFLFGLAYYWSSDLPQSEHFLRRAITLDPNHSEAWDNLGITVQDAGRPGDAIPYYTTSIDLNPNSRAPRWHRALARLTLGEYQNGWEDYEFRPGITEAIAKTNFPRWNGEINKNLKLIILPEQGIGDEIMFSSCVPDAVNIVGQTILVCSPKLELLFSRSFPNTVVTTNYPTSNSVLDSNTSAISIGSLPLYFRRNQKDFALRGPYLTAHPSSIESWRRKLNSLGPGLKIGISWRGGTAITRDTKRSIPLIAWESILRHQNAHFISLQYTPCDQEIVDCNSKFNVSITHWQQAIDDYDQTAALIASLDLIISVQTAVVHLCGALDKPTFALVPARPEWRYGFNHNSMDWYSSVSVIRQQTPNDWSSVIEHVARKLKEFSNA